MIKIKGRATTIILSVLYVPCAAAQSLPNAAPQRPKVDRNGVDIQSGSVVFDEPGLLIGQDTPAEMEYKRSYIGSFRTNYTAARDSSQTSTPYSQTELMTYGNISKNEAYSQLGMTSLVLYDGVEFGRLKDGTTLTFAKDFLSSSYGAFRQTIRLLSKVTKPNGVIETLHYQDTGLGGPYGTRLISVTNNAGYQIKFTYASNLIPSSPTSSSEWNRVVEVKAINNSVDYCSPTASTCSLTHQWPTMSYDTTSLGSHVTTPSAEFYYQRTNQNPAVMKIRNGLSEVFKEYKIEAINSPCIQYNCPGNNLSLKVTEAKVGEDITTYQYIDSDGDLEVLANYPEGQESYLSKNNGDGIIHTNALGQINVFEEEHGNIVALENAEGNRWEYEIDQRGNIHSQVLHNKEGTSSISIERDFPENCIYGNRLTCNKPTAIRDANGNETVFRYDTSHGGLLSEMSPPPSPGASRPLTLQSWIERYAYTLNATGELVQAGPPIWVLSEKIECQTAPGSNDDTTCDQNGGYLKTVYEYGPDNSPESLLVKGIAVHSEGKVFRTCYKYNRLGKRVQEIKPKFQATSCN